ncbi:MAG: MBL fold metallo-hydrolase [bacterium]|nr:MBL fold metallo-hydrolase [bacterium]
MRFFIVGLLLAAATLATSAATAGPEREVTPSVHPELQHLADRSGEPRMIQVSPRVHVAFAYDFANITFIEGDDGVIVIDAGWAKDAAAEAIAAFQKQVSKKPIVALVYSHGHADHVGGAAAFIEAAGPNLAVYAEKSWKEYQLERVGPSATHFVVRAVAQMGLLLPVGPEGRIPTGGGRMRATSLGFRYVPATHAIDGETELQIAGVRIVAIPMPSETSDQLLFWLPDEKVAFAGDIAAGALPILSTPRAERTRVPTGFIDGIERLMSLPLETLIAGHNPPVVGRAEALDALTQYRDAAQFIYDQTMRALNRNLSLEQAAQAVRLPPHLANHPLLQDHYHRLPWVVKGVYSRFGGWFQGDAATLNPLEPQEEAERMIELAGGADRILERAQSAFKEGDYPWSAQLAGYLIRTKTKLRKAVALKADALRAMAYASDSGNERNYMLTQALAMEGKLDTSRAMRAPKPLELMRMLNTRELFRLVGPNLDPKRCLEDDLTVGFDFTDLGEEHRYTVRRGVGHYRARSGPEPAVRVKLSRETFERILANRLSWSAALEQSKAVVSGPADRFDHFLSFFDGWSQN